MATATTAHAHPNIALIKYWGKQPGEGNYPAVPSLSITLDTLTTTTEITTSNRSDRVFFDGNEVRDQKVLNYLALLRGRFGIPFLQIRTHNNFPTAAGLASSASGFAALTAAINQHCQLDLPVVAQSDLARRASGSAARSMLGGFVALQGPKWTAECVLEPAEWPLATVIAVTNTNVKAVSSSAGMVRSQQTSPFYAAWVASGSDDFPVARRAILARDFDALASIAEFSCLKMHAVMLSTNPGLIYWTPATVACMHAVRELRQHGVPVFFTIDAGPQVKAVCLPEARDEVHRSLSQLSGVQRIMTAGLGRGARTVDP